MTATLDGGLVAALRNAAARLERADYRHDPVAWARDRLGVHLWSRQRDIAESVVRHRRTAVRSAHGLGKSLVASVLAMWWIDTHPPGQAFVVTTAPSHEQVHAVLWENIRGLHARAGLSGEVQRSDRWLDEQGRLVGFGRRPPDHAESAFQGIHRRYVLVILDEAGGIPGWLWTAAEAITTGTDCRILAIGNPDDNASQFARVCGSPLWHSLKISAFDSPNFTGEPVPDELRHVLVSTDWVESARAQWGETNPLYLAKVLGEFADSEDGLIPLSWVRAANLRHTRWVEQGCPSPPGRRILGVDVARYGADQSAMAVREADTIRELARWAKADTTATTERVHAALDAHPQAVAVVDVNGVGAGVVDLLRARRKSVVAFNASQATRRRDSSGSWGFRNLRSASWYNLRELLDPALGASLALPEDDQLAADLTTPHYQPTTGAKILVEDKDSIRKRLGRSPDSGDAVVMACWHNPTTGRAPDPDTKPVRRVRRHADQVVWA